MDVLMPQLGETVSEGTIAAWLRKVGDQVVAGDALFEIETDKTTMEVQAVASGVLAEIRVPAGETVPVGTVLGVIGEAAAPRLLAAETVPAPVAAGSAFDIFDAVKTPQEHWGPKSADGVRITPLARRMIGQNGLDAAMVAADVRRRGGGVVRKAEVLAAIGRAGAKAQTTAVVADGAPAQAAAAVAPRESVMALNRVRQASARHLTETWRTVPHVLQAIEIDFEQVAHVRAGRKEAFKSLHGVALTFLPFIARAVCLALQSYPQINARFEGDHLALSRDVHLGIAVDLGHEGLVVPVVHHADLMNVTGLAKAIDARVQKARAGRLAREDLEGGNYTISNNGSFGTLFTAPLIHAPQVAILSTDRIAKRAVVKETEVGDVIVARHVGIVAQSFDHRACDGAYAAAYLAQLKEIIESKDWAGEIG